MKKLFFFFIILFFSNAVLADTQWITKKTSKNSKIKSLEQMFVDGLLTRDECIKAKKKILKNSPITGCKKVQEKEATYIKKKEPKKKEPKEKNLAKKGIITFPKCKLYAGEKDFYTTFDIDLEMNDVYRTFYAKPDFFYKYLEIIKNDKTKVETKIIKWGTEKNQYMNYVFDKRTNNAYEIQYRDKLGKKRTKKTKLVCDKVVGKWKKQSTQVAKKEKPKKKKKIVKEVQGIEEDNIKPSILIASELKFDSPDYVIKGTVTDKGGSEKFYLFIKKTGGKERRIKLNNGKFEITRFSYGEEIQFIARDEYSNETIKNVKIIIQEPDEVEIAKKYDELKPYVKGIKNNNRIAIIIGVENYENTVKALYANNDAQIFNNFAIRSLGISKSNIKVLIEDKARRIDTIKTLKKWLPRKVVPNQSELFVFFSGHGYPSQSEGLHLIPQDGDPTLLEETSLSHKAIINLIQKTEPKSVTMFVDACYSGQSNTGEVLVAGLKPLALLNNEENIPSNFNFFSSSANNQTSGTIREAKHGIFSYYLMKGLSKGEADLNNDRQITNNELFTYLQNQVSEEANIQNRDQIPKLNSSNPDHIIMKY